MSPALLIVQPSGVSAFNRINPFFALYIVSAPPVVVRLSLYFLCSCSISILSQNTEIGNNIARDLCFKNLLCIACALARLA